MYSVCAAVSGGGYLNPCTWGAAPQITLTTGQALTGYRLVLKKGAPIQVRLIDAGGILETTAAPHKTAPHVLLGVQTPKHIFEALPITSKGNGQRTHQGTIALDGDTLLHVRGAGVRLTDDAGAAVNVNGATLKVRPGNNNQPVVLTFQVLKP